MHWIYILGLVLIVVVFAALTGAKPEEAKSVRRTRMMSAAKIVLGIVGLILVWLLLRSYGMM